MNESDLLPKQVCIECWTRINKFHEFYEDVLSEQAIYLNDLVKYEHVDLSKPDQVDATIEQMDTLYYENDSENESTIKNEVIPIKSESSSIFFDETPAQITTVDIKSIQCGNFEVDQFETDSSEQNTEGENVSGL